MVLVPLLSLGHVREVAPTRVRVAPAAGLAGEDRLSATSSRPSRSRALVLAFERANAPDPTTTTSTAAPAPVVTAALRRAAPPTTARRAVRTTTTVPKAAPKPAPKPRPATTTTASTASTAAPRTQEGDASWYDPPRPEICAHRTLRFGTVVTVTNLANGRQTTCEVGDRGPFVRGRIIDLARHQFAALAPTSSGVIRVRIEW